MIFFLVRNRGDSDIKSVLRQCSRAIIKPAARDACHCSACCVSPCLPPYFPPPELPASLEWWPEGLCQGSRCCRVFQVGARGWRQSVLSPNTETSSRCSHIDTWQRNQRWVVSQFISIIWNHAIWIYFTCMKQKGIKSHWCYEWISLNSWHWKTSQVIKIQTRLDTETLSHSSLWSNSGLSYNRLQRGFLGCSVPLSGSKVWVRRSAFDSTSTFLPSSLGLWLVEAESHPGAPSVKAVQLSHDRLVMW